VLRLLEGPNCFIVSTASLPEFTNGSGNGNGNKGHNYVTAPSQPEISNCIEGTTTSLSNGNSNKG
jgi:hypothetical protein